jgi:hypothetical protein
MASHRDRRRQICEKDFSPPESVFGWFPLPLPSRVLSGSTCDKGIRSILTRMKVETHHQIKDFVFMAGNQSSSKAPLCEKIHELHLRSSRYQMSELLPPKASVG